MEQQQQQHDSNVVPLGRPPLRVWDLDQDSSRHDRLVAAPSDQQIALDVDDMVNLGPFSQVTRGTQKVPTRINRGFGQRI